MSVRNRGASSSKSDAGGSPAATHFLCFAKESKQRKATRGSSPGKERGVPCVTRNDRPLRNSGSWMHHANGSVRCSPSDSPRGKPLSFLRYSATLIGPHVIIHDCRPGGGRALIYVERHLAGIAARKCLKKRANYRVCYRARLCQPRLRLILPSLRGRALLASRMSICTGHCLIPAR